MTVSQTLGGALFVSIGESIFTNHLINSLRVTAPFVNPGQVLAAGSVALGKHFSEEYLPGILLSYMMSLCVVFVLCAALAAVATFISFATPWISVKKSGEIKEKGGLAMGV
jgi:hypothetical protein